MNVKYLNLDGLLYFWGLVKVKLGEKVDKDGAKMLSDNNFSNDEKSKLSGVETGADVNIIESILVNNVTVSPTEKVVSLTIATKISELDNDSLFQNKSEVDGAIATAVGQITSFEFLIVTALPSAGVGGTIYLLANAGNAPNIYDEYIWIEGSFEKIGTTSIDLSGYVQFSNLISISNAEINIVIAT